MSIQPLWLTYFIEILLVLEFHLTKTYFGTFSYKAHFRPQISSNDVRVIANHTKIDTLFDSGSQVNMISEEVVKKLHLVIVPHEKPYPLGWVTNDT